jgi:hypothetical protein
MRSLTSTRSRRSAKISLLGLCAILIAMVGLSGAQDATSDVLADNGAGAQPGAPALFVIDSANTLSSFDVHGKSLQKMVFKTTVGTLDGGMTLAMGRIYVSYVKAASRGAGSGVFAFDAITLKQVLLHIGAFSVPDGASDAGVIRAIAYDPDDGRFHVAVDGLGLLAFDRSGQYIPGPSKSTAAISAIAYDSKHTTLWAIADQAVVRYGEENASPLFGVPVAHAFGVRRRAPSALAYCSVGGDGASAAEAIAVVFGGTNSGHHGSAGTAQSYDVAGKPIGSLYGGRIFNPHGVSCSSRGEVFIAADNGLLEYTVQGSIATPLGDLRQLSSPVYGVLAAY